MKTVLTPQTLACEFTGTSEAHSENQWWRVSYGKLIVYLGRHSLRCLQLILRMRKALILNVHNCHLRLCGKTQSHVGGPSGTEESAFFTVDSLTGGSRGTFWETLALEKERREMPRCSVCTGNIRLDRYWWKNEEQAPRKHAFRDTAKESNLEIKEKEAGGSHHVTSGASFKSFVLLTCKANSIQGSESEAQRK